MNNTPNILTATHYYLTSIITLLKETNFWSIPIAIVKDKTLIKTKQNKFIVRDLMDIWTLKETTIDQQYEIFRKVKKGDLVIDIGAAFGDFSIYASKKAKHVYSYEIDKNRLTLLKKNISLNKVKNINIFNKKVTSVDQILKEQKISKCDFFKIDCEGSEYPILLKSSLKSLKKIKYLAGEVHLFNDEMISAHTKLIQLFKKANFEVIEKNNQVHSYIRYLYAKNKTK